jgi:hypothetical protein
MQIKITLLASISPPAIWTHATFFIAVHENSFVHYFQNLHSFVFCAIFIDKKQSRYTPWRRLGERRYSSYSFSTLALDGGGCSASRPGRAFTPGERTPGTHCTGGWVGPRAGLVTEDRGKILCLRRGSNPVRPVVQPVVRHYTAWANPAPIFIDSYEKYYVHNCTAKRECH